MPSKNLVSILALLVSVGLASTAHAQSPIPGAAEGPGAGSPTTPRTDDTLNAQPMGNDTEQGTVMEHENKITLDKNSGSGTDGTDGKTTGSGTTSESIPGNIPPARAQ
ncbi:hypothetical protein [Pseudomonas sp. RIT-PI-AD]|uniref:hypothetical protein n=1 Tax=Pseudomonas sp. RIT-PI-AD TaxID=3035294 RepID=UPI0021D9D755|nr:hypothetical protein [Pseudomonas sp. RIT-PI-AD]